MRQGSSMLSGSHFHDLLMIGSLGTKAYGAATTLSV